jgi:hypothetical protein
MMFKSEIASGLWIEVLYIPLVCFSLICMRVSNGAIAVFSSCVVGLVGSIGFIIAGSMDRRHFYAFELLRASRGECAFTFLESPVLCLFLGIWSVCSLTAYESMPQVGGMAKILRSVFMFSIASIGLCVFWRRYLYVLQVDAVELQWHDFIAGVCICLGCVIECCSASARLWNSLNEMMGVLVTDKDDGASSSESKLQFSTLFEQVCMSLLGMSLLAMTVTSETNDLRWLAYIISSLLFVV